MAAPTTQLSLPASHLVYGKKALLEHQWQNGLVWISSTYPIVISLLPHSKQEPPLKSLPDKTHEKQWQFCPKQGLRKKTSNKLFQDSSPTCPATVFFCYALQNVSQKHWWIWQSWIHHLNSYRNSGRIFTKILKASPPPLSCKRCRC